MNILYLNHYAGTPALGMEYRPYYLAREWVRAGHRVTMVAADFSHVRARQPQAGTEGVDGGDGRTAGRGWRGARADTIRASFTGLSGPDAPASQDRLQRTWGRVSEGAASTPRRGCVDEGQASAR